MKTRTAKARTTLVAILFIAMIFVFADNTISVYADSPNVTAHSKAEIVQRLKTNSASISEPHTFEITPTQPNTPGALSDASKQSALKMLNNIRYVAGLPDVLLDNNYGEKSQAAAFVLASVGQGLSHAPKDDYSKPNEMSDNIWNLGHEGAGSSNLSAGRGTLNATVLGWMDDGDKSNVDRVGHRRWAINPKMGKVGFGAAYNSESRYGNYYAEYSFDNSGSGTQTNVVWPAQIMPIEFFGNNIPWSLSTGSSISNVSGVEVTLTRRTSSPSGSGSWTFKGSESYTAAGSGKYFNINNQGFGQKGCIIFRPDNVNYRVGDIFDVKITGVVSSPITYTVEFISGYPVETMAFDSAEYRLTSNYQTITPTVTPASALEYEINYSSSDENVVTVDSNGKITKVGLGEATITATIDGRFTFSGNPITSSYVVKVPKSLSDVNVNYNDKVYYSGKTADIGLVITDGNKTLVEGTDYTLSIPDDAIKPRMSGNTYYNYTATITGKGNYGDTLYRNFWIYKKSLYNCDVVLSPSTVEYTGTKQTPTVSVYNGDVPLTEGEDYDVTSNDGGANVGTYSVRISACSNSDCYIGSTSETFTITPKAVTKEMVGNIGTVAYDGKAQEPDVVVTDGDKTLEKGTDYDVEYTNNIGIGTASVVIAGKGNYTGSIECEFEIVSPEMAELQSLIEELEADKGGESDEEFLVAIEDALIEARAAVNGTNVDAEYLNSIISSVRSKRAAALSALKEKKETERQEAEAASRANQSGEGGAVGPGASIEFAEKSILSSASDEGPKGTKYAPLQLRSTKQGNTNINLTWNKVKGAKTYIIYGNACGKKNKMKRLTSVSGKSFNVKKIDKKLKKGTYHKFMVVALDSNNNVVTSSKTIHVATKGNKKIANPTKVTVKKPKTLKKGKMHKLAGKVTGLKGKPHRKIAYESSNPTIATVSNKGVIKGKKKGTCYVYAYAQNGVFQKVKVVVK